MLDIQLLRDNPEAIATKLKTRGFVLDVPHFKTLDNRRKELQTATQELQNQRNRQSKAIGIAKSKGEDIGPLLNDVGNISLALEDNKKALDALMETLETLLMSLPNIPHPTVPIGSHEDDNIELRRHKTPPKFSFTPLSHDILGENLGQMDFAMAAKITGSRFVVMHRHLARLHRALTQFMMDVHVQEHGYQEIYVPYLVNSDSLYGTGQLPKFEEDLFKLNGETSYYLTSTAEIPVTNTVRDEIIPLDTLPLQYVCHSPCFRSEAGSYGRDTKGLIRQHQFEKVELVWITTPERSYDCLEKLVNHAETILQKLDLPYRVVTLCTGDMGASAAKTYDIEVWLPSQNTYREISSCSNMEAFQARRMKARYRPENSTHTQWLHTLNGSGLAVGRTLVAVMENYQEENGNIRIPSVLQPYMDGATAIGCQ